MRMQEGVIRAWCRPALRVASPRHPPTLHASPPPQDDRRASASGAAGGDGKTLSQQLRQAQFTVGLLEKRIQELEAAHKEDTQKQSTPLGACVPGVC